MKAPHKDATVDAVHAEAKAAAPPPSIESTEGMYANQAKALQERTAAKLRYARVHLDELKAQGPPSGDDFDKAHQESFLFHLLGTRDALRAELNHYCGAGRKTLKKQGITRSEVGELYKLEQDETSWLCAAKDMRDHSTHVQGAPRAYFMGGEDDGKVKLKNPRTGSLTERHFIVEFEDWLNKMETLVLLLRASAVLKARSDSSGRKP